MTARITRRGKGRPGTEKLVGNLISLYSSLNKPGDTITVNGIAQQLDVSLSEAQRYLDLLLSASVMEDTYLPIYLSESHDAVTLAFDSDIKGRTCRLSMAETSALLAALDAAGISLENPVRQIIEESYIARAAYVKKAIVPSSSLSAEEQSFREICAEAILDGNRISFFYQNVSDFGSPDSKGVLRTVDPLCIRQVENALYLDAYDIDRQAERTFRFDRMEHIRICGKASSHKRSTVSHTVTENHVVTLYFEDSRWLDYLDWPGLHSISSPKDSSVYTSPSSVVTSSTCEDNLPCKPIKACIDWYGTRWLARRIAACGGAVTTDNEELNLLARSIAQEELVARS